VSNHSIVLSTRKVIARNWTGGDMARAGAKMKKGDSRMGFHSSEADSPPSPEPRLDLLQTARWPVSFVCRPKS
jgi:hypothetical protein